MAPEYLACAGTVPGKGGSWRLLPPVETQQGKCSVGRAIPGDTQHSVMESINVHRSDSGP